MPLKFNRQNWLMNQLRRLSIKYPPIIKATNRTKEIYYIKAKNGNDVKRVKYSCEMCGRTDLKRHEVELDHIIEIADVENGFVDFNTFIERLFCGEENLQLLCKKPCHESKTRDFMLNKNKLKKEDL